MKENIILKRAKILLPMYEAVVNIIEQLSSIESIEADQAPLYTAEDPNVIPGPLWTLEQYRRLLVSCKALRADQAEVIGSALSSLEIVTNECRVLASSEDPMIKRFMEHISPAITESFVFGEFYPEDEGYWKENIVDSFEIIAGAITITILYDEEREISVVHSDFAEILKNALSE